MSTLEQSRSEVFVDQRVGRGEFRLLTSNCGILDLQSRAKVELTGSHRVRWLNGMITNNIRDLAPGHGVYGFLLTPQGHIQGDVYAYQRGDSLLVDTDKAHLEKVLGIFRRYIIMDDVKIADLSGKLTAIGLAGPSCKDMLKRAGFEFSDIQRLQFADVTWQGITMAVVRGDNPLVDSFELWLAPENVSQVWAALVAAGAGPVGSAALELLRIASGIPRYGQDIRDRDLPQETGQERALSFTKGCYIGQEIVERIRSRGNVHRVFTGFEVDGPLPAVGGKIQADGKDAGEITSTTYLPLESGDRPVALGYIRREFSSPGQEVAAGDTKLRLAALPFEGLVRESKQNS
jgi:folate-binding protein YgfZ